MSAKWTGQCAQCGAWGTVSASAVPEPSRRRKSGIRSGHSARRSLPETAATLALSSGPSLRRWSTGIGEFDRVLSGGIADCAAILLGGAPGCGKSTLALQAAGGFLAARPEAGTLYVSAEETAAQVADRARRVIEQDCLHRLHILSTGSAEDAVAAVDSHRPALVVFDSVQTLAYDALDSAAGNISQVRAVSEGLVRASKSAGAASLLVGHVTKDGAIAGPRTLEHLVDVVLYFETERDSELRVLRNSKNRFGGTRETGVFVMGDRGLESVPSLGEALLGERLAGASGSALGIAVAGSRALLLEVQALVNATQGVPRLRTVGVSPMRAAMIAAVLERHCGVRLAGRDVFVSLAGGISVTDPSLDLAVAAALASAARREPLPDDAAFVGEVGLTGEVRNVGHASARLTAAASAGTATVFGAKGLVSAAHDTVQVHTVRSVREVLHRVFARSSE